MYVSFRWFLSINFQLELRTRFVAYLLWAVPGLLHRVGGVAGNAALTYFKLFITGGDSSLPAFLLFLKNSSLLVLEQLTDIYAKDLVTLKYRFTVLYALLSTTLNLRLFVQVRLSEFTFMNSVSNIYSSAEWSEREVWDMFGIFSLGNYDMRRLLTDYSFTGFPLRKTFPMTGFLEVFYEDFFQCLVAERVGLRQGYRTFSYKKNAELALKRRYLGFSYDNFYTEKLTSEVFRPSTLKKKAISQSANCV